MERILYHWLLILFMSVPTRGEQRHGYTPPPKEAGNPGNLPKYSYRPTVASTFPPTSSPTVRVTKSKSKVPSKNPSTFSTTSPPTWSRRTQKPSNRSSILGTSVSSIIPTTVQSRRPISTEPTLVSNTYPTSAPSYNPNVGTRRNSLLISKKPTLDKATKTTTYSKSYAPTVYPNSTNISLTIHPTKYKTSTSHNPTPTSTPSVYHSSISHFPTAVPSPNDSTSNSYAPTNYGTQQLCNATTSSGLFGSQASNNMVYISYMYQIEVKNYSRILDTLTHLEIAISDALLPSLFSFNCQKRLQRSLSNTATSKINPESTSILMGMSSAPSDLPSSNVCVGQVTPGATCFHVQGRFTLFLTIMTNVSMFHSINNVSQKILKTSMNDGSLLYSDDNIVRVVYLSDTTSNDIITAGIDGYTSPLNQGGSRMPVYGWILLVLILSLITTIITIFSRYRRWKQKHVADGLEHSSSYHSAVHGDDFSIVHGVDDLSVAHGDDQSSSPDQGDDNGMYDADSDLSISESSNPISYTKIHNSTHIL